MKKTVSDQLDDALAEVAGLKKQLAERDGVIRQLRLEQACAKFAKKPTVKPTQAEARAELNRLLQSGQSQAASDYNRLHHDLIHKS
jgi:hypothetical protein